MMFRRKRSLTAALGLTLILGCGDDGTQPESSGTLIGPAGGTVVSGDATLQVPAGALGEDVTITVQEVTSPGGLVPSGFLSVPGTVFEFSPDGLAFAQLATLTLSYDAADLPAGVSPSELSILHLSGGADVLESTVDEASHTVTASIDGFSSYAIGLDVGSLDRVACPALSPATTSGVPLDRVPLGSFPTTFEPPLAAIVTADTLPPSFALIEVDEQGAADLVVPIHPSADPAGGPVRLNVTDGTRACAAFDFTIQGLPAAPGELSGIADALQAIVTEQATVLETTPAELVATAFADLPSTLVPLALVQSIVDHPGNANSLRAMANGTWPGAAEARLDLLEPLLARTGIRSALASALASSAGGASGGGPSAAGPAAVAGASCTPDAVGSDAGLLDACMDAAASAAFELAGASGQVLGDLSEAFGYLAFVPGLGEATAVGGAVTWTALNAKERTAALLPSVLTGITVQYEPVEFMEDEEGDGSWSAEVTASNLPWDMGREALEALLQAAGVVATVDKFQIGGPEIDETLATFLTGPVASQLLANGSNGVIPAETFGPVDITAEAWSESEIHGGAFELVTHNTYEPRAAGTATLSVRTKIGEFAGNEQSWDGDLTVTAIDVDIAPTEVNLAGGQGQAFTVTVLNAVHPEALEVLNPGGLQGIVGDITQVAEGAYQIDYTAPMTPDPAQPDLLTVHHTSTSGARGYSTEERLATATIRFGQVVITPGTYCLDPDQTLDFSAQVVGLEDQGVEWSADIGSIDAVTGAYTAPPSVPDGGIATITARSTANPALSAEVYINIGGCSCSWDLNLDGNGLESQTGQGAGFQVLDASGLWTITLSGTSSVTFQTEGIPIGQTGSFDAVVSGSLGVLPGDLFYSSGEAGPATLLLTENDNDIVAGTVNGTVSVTPSSGDPPTPRDAPFSASFRVVSDGFPTTGGGFTSYACTVGG